MIVFFFFQGNRLRRQFAWIVKHYFLWKRITIFWNVVWWMFTQMLSITDKTVQINNTRSNEGWNPTGEEEEYLIVNAKSVDLGQLASAISLNQVWAFVWTHYENTPIQIYWKFHYKKNKKTKKNKQKFSDKNSDIFHISAQNIDCWYSLEPPRRWRFYEYPQSMFLSRNKKNNIYHCKP